MSDETKTQAGGSGGHVVILDDIEAAAEEFVEAALDSLGLVWEPEDIEAEVEKLTAAAVAWRSE